jgi:hypothetical protein
MFSLAILIGIYSCVILCLGVLGFFYKSVINLATLFFLIVGTFYFRKTIVNSIKLFLRFNLKKVSLKSLRKNFLTLFLLGLILAQALVNLIGALGPELSFDALWYHLTLPKIFLQYHKIFHIQGNLLLYSDMPKLTEMLYSFGLSLGSEVYAKLIHYFFGILCLIAIYKFTVKYTGNKLMALFALTIFYSNLVVGWESITAYIDLSRAFFEILALWAFLNWFKEKNTKWLIESAVMLGLAISTKVIAIESLLIFLLLITYVCVKYNFDKKKWIKSIFVFTFFSLLIPLPWFIFSYLNTGNIVYPFFSAGINMGTNFEIPKLQFIYRDFVDIFLYSNDPISPVYLIFIPLIFVYFKKFKAEFKVIGLYSFLALIFWYITPRIGGGRFILPYLPAFSILTAYCLLRVNKKQLRIFLISIILLTSSISICYRFIANYKFISYDIGKETKSEFLSKNLNFNFGDFYDTDGYFYKNIATSDKVLLYGFHNLFYVNFPFIDSSWIKTGDSFNYVASQNTTLPERFKNWKLIYENKKTGVKLYNLYGIKWHY